MADQRLKDLYRETVEEILSTLSGDARLKGLSAEERIKGLTPEERLKGLSAEDVARALSPETLEAVLRQLKANSSSANAK